MPPLQNWFRYSYRLILMLGLSSVSLGLAPSASAQPMAALSRVGQDSTDFFSQGREQFEVEIRALMRGEQAEMPQLTVGPSLQTGDRSPVTPSTKKRI